MTVVAMLGTATAGTCTAILPEYQLDSATCSLPASLAANTYSVAALGRFRRHRSRPQIRECNEPGAEPCRSSPPRRPRRSPRTPRLIAELRPMRPCRSLRPTVAPSSRRPPMPWTSRPSSKAAARIRQPAPPRSRCRHRCRYLRSRQGTVRRYLRGHGKLAGHPNFLTSTSSTDFTVLNGTAVNITVPSTATAGDSTAHVIPNRDRPPDGDHLAHRWQYRARLNQRPNRGRCSASTAPIGGDTITADFVSPDGFASSSGTALMNVRVAPPAPPPGATALCGGIEQYPGRDSLGPGPALSAAGIGAITVASYSTNPTGTVMGGTGVFYDVAVGVGSTLVG